MARGLWGVRVFLAQLRLIGREVLFDGDRRGRGEVGSWVRIGAARTAARAFPSLVLLVCLSVCLPVVQRAHPLRTLSLSLSSPSPYTLSSAIPPPSKSQRTHDITTILDERASFNRRSATSPDDALRNSQSRAARRPPAPKWSSRSLRWWQTSIGR